MGFVVNNRGNNSRGLYGQEHFKIKNPFKGKVKKAVKTITTAKNNAIQDVKGGVKEAVNKVTTVKNAAIGKVKDKMGDLAEKVGFAVMIPYKPVMVSILKKRGHNISNSAPIASVSTLFYDAVIKGKTNFNYANYSQKFKHLSEDVTNTAIGAGSVALAATTGVPPGVSAGIIKAILAWFKKIKEKKDQGATLSPEENIAVQADEQIEAKGEVITVEEKGWLQRLLDSIFKPKKPESFRRRIDARNKKAAPVANKLLNMVVANTSGPTRPLQSATEIAYANMLKPGVVQNLAGRGTVRSANDLVGNPIQSKLTPNSWFQDKGGKWHWVNNRGKIVA